MEWFLWVYRQAYWCGRRFCPRETPPRQPFINPSSLPWLWIGIKYSDENVVTVTNIVNSHLHAGMRVTTRNLSRMTGFGGGTWRYIDTETLEERDFPSEGFIIEDVLDKPLSDSE